MAAGAGVTPAIEVEGLSFGFAGAEPVLRDVTFRVWAGERVALVGSNGAGKSTLLWCLLSLYPFRGQVRLWGLPPKQARARVAMVFQNPEDQLFMPALVEDAALSLLNRGIPRQEAFERARAALRRMGLEAQADRPARWLSLGQRKRAAIAAALAGSPELLILDEPTAELDGRAVRYLGEALRELPITLLIAGHDLEFLRASTTRALVLRGGILVADGPTQQLLKDRALLDAAGLI